MKNFKELSNEQILLEVQAELKNVTTNEIAQAFIESNDSKYVEECVYELVLDSIEWASDEEGWYGPIGEYLMDYVLDTDKILSAEAFETEADAENEGYFWNDEIENWIKLDFTKTHHIF